MHQVNMKVVNQDMKTLLTDAQTLFSDAAAMTGSKADELRSKGMEMLEQARETAQNFQHDALKNGKKLVSLSEAYVQENPWVSIGIAAGIGVLLGAVLVRKT